MPYTIMKGLVWLLIALLLGLAIGWLLRSITATRQMRKLRAAKVDHSELDRLRARVAQLEPLVAELEAMRADRGRPDPNRPAVSGDPTTAAHAPPEPNRSIDGGGYIDQAVAAPDESDESDEPDQAPAPTVPNAPGGISSLPTTVPAATQTSSDAPSDTSGDVAFAELNLVAAGAVIGRKIKLDDLTVIEGIGPAIADLCVGIGIDTWSELAATEISLLRTMLADAGPQFQLHDPTTWPEQAGLLAVGDWEEFRRVSDAARGGDGAE